MNGKSSAVAEVATGGRIRNAGTESMSAEPKTPPLAFQPLLDEASRRTGLTDFGSNWFHTPFRILLDALNAEARLSDFGRDLEAENILNALTTRLQTIEATKRHPEILEERVTVAAVIVALHRTGSTLMHRLLSSAPSMTAVSWWEAQHTVPFPGEERGRPVARRAAAQQKLDAWLQAMPELMSMHPMSLDQPDEETTILEQVFMGLSPESFFWIPSYARWSETADAAPAYRDLRLALQYLQWQDPARARRAWVLKTPSHLLAPDALTSEFPEALIIQTHRDPVKTTPSFCSMTNTLHGMYSNNVDPHALGAHWSKRLSRVMERWLEARARIGEHRFYDVRYEELVQRPLEIAADIFRRMGRQPTEADRAAMAAWMAANGRDNRPSHHYSLEQFGLTAEGLKQDFAPYRRRFIDAA